MNTRNREFALAYGSQEIRVHYGKVEAWQQVAGMEAGERSWGKSRESELEVGEAF